MGIQSKGLICGIHVFIVMLLHVFSGVSAAVCASSSAAGGNTFCTDINYTFYVGNVSAAERDIKAMQSFFAGAGSYRGQPCCEFAFKQLICAQFFPRCSADQTSALPVCEYYLCRSFEPVNIVRSISCFECSSTFAVSTSNISECTCPNPNATSVENCAPTSTEFSSCPTATRLAQTTRSSATLQRIPMSFATALCIIVSGIFVARYYGRE